MEPIQLTEGQYWKLRTIESNGKLLREQIQRATEEMEALRKSHFALCGMKEDVNYTLNDDALTVTPKE